eukprot:m.85361 g.85361  ORF g.85361 m.85361 type:complete len:885 (+) comp21264_c0_seq1:72-2726(+)
MLRQILLVLLLLLPHACLSWTYGDAATVNVSTKTFTFTVSFANSDNGTWLESLPPSVHCNNQWYNANDGTLVLHNVTNFTSSDSFLGSFHALTAKWGFKSSTTQDFETSIYYYPDRDAFVFEQTFTTGCSEAAVDQPTDTSREFNSTLVALSEFPSFNASASSYLAQLGFVTWAGRFSHDKSLHGIGLEGFLGGSSGGPLVLFEPDQVQPSTLVLSTMNNFMSGMLGMSVHQQANSNQTCNFEYNTDYRGNDLKGIYNVTSAEDCCDLCANFPGCKFFSWTGQAPPPYTYECWLKYSDAGRYEVSPHVSGSVGNSALVAGVQGQVLTLPSGFTQKFVMKATRKGYSQPSGINEAMHQWGALFKAAYRTSKMKNDLVTSKLGYWTDNGGVFYGGNTLNESTAIQIFKALNQSQVPVKYLQLDPYWYYHHYPNDPDDHCGIGATVWNPLPSLFPNGLKHLSDAIGVPLLLYSNAFCPNSHRHYPNITFINSTLYKQHSSYVHDALPSPEDSFAFYDLIMGNYTSRGMQAFEVDFMDFNFLLYPTFMKNATASFFWAEGMARAAEAHGISIQYCMTLPAYIMQSAQFKAVTNARASEDNFPTNENRWRIPFTSVFYAALDIKPFMDVIWTTGDQPNPYGQNRDNVEFQAILATLSQGPLGIGDNIGYTNASLIARAARADGTLLHPSYPATPIDAMYQQNQVLSGYVFQTHSIINTTYENDGQVEPQAWHTVFAVDVEHNASFSVTKDDIWPPMDDDIQYVAVTFPLRCENGSAWTNCDIKLMDDALHLSTGGPMGPVHAYSLYTLAPLQSNGWALLGDVTPFVSVSPNRISNVTFTSHGITVSLVGAPTEKVSVAFLAPSANYGYKVVIYDVQIGADGTATLKASN